MKNLSAYNSLSLLTAFLLMGTIAYAQNINPANWDKKTADKWVKSKVWAPNLKIKLDPSVNSREFAKQYYANKEGWDKALAFLQNTDWANIKVGRYNIDGENGVNVNATVSDDPLKDTSISNWEVHKKYIDLHYVIEGKEKVGATPVGDVKQVVTPFDATKDIGYYHFDGGKYYIATPKNFFLFFPTEAHRPHLKVPGYEKAKKVVFKIRVVE